ncbi:hypothetical protein [Terribacillus saccharophilus]|uniref:hypothetical protein n=1 Tax=Terribacillus saccharophilus TaxID=361277 RepID=UPI003D2781FE
MQIKITPESLKKISEKYEPGLGEYLRSKAGCKPTLIRAIDYENKTSRLTVFELEQIRQRSETLRTSPWLTVADEGMWRFDIPKLLTEVETLILEKAAARRMLDELIGEMANAAEAGYALAPETVREDLEKIRKELIDHGE